MGIFKACDIRGRFGTELTVQDAYRLGQAAGSELSEQRVVVGGDVRPSTTELKPALISGLLTAGCQVVDLGILPTPAFYFGKDYYGAAGGVMVTGSHNPRDDNGFKVNLGPLPVTEEALAGLARRMETGEFVTRPGGTLDKLDCVPIYEDFIVRKARTGGRPMPGGPGKIVVDAGNGCYSEIAPRVLRRLGCAVAELYCKPDGTFPNRAPNPAVAANLGALCAAVLHEGAAMGVAFDGDGDRAVFVDQRGHVVDSDRAIVLLAGYALRQRAQPGDERAAYAPEVIFDIKCSSIVPEQVRAAGGTPVMEKSGHIFIKTALLARHAVFGGEISGHFFFGELGGDDGLYATISMLHLLGLEKQGLAELAGALPRYPITPDLRLPCSADFAQAVVRDLAEAFAGQPGCEVSTLDGTRVAWPDGWALARPSVTEPLITLRFEAHSEQRLREIQALVSDRVPAISELLAISGRRLPGLGD